MKLLLLLIVPIALSQIGQTPPRPGKTFLEKLEQEPWYFCDSDSLWTYDKNCRPVRCTDPSIVKKLRVETVLEEVYLNGYDDPCTETDSVIPGRTLALTTSRLRNLAYPLSSFGNLAMLDVSRHYFNSFPFEVFSPPQLKVLNISSLCIHDICEKCLYYNPDRETDDSETSDANREYDETDLASCHAKLRSLLLIRHDNHFSVRDIALLDSINEANNMPEHETLFENPVATCLSHEKRRQFHDVYLRPVKP